MTLKKRLEKLQGKLKVAPFAKKCGVPRTTMSGYLTGQRKTIQPDIAQKIATAHDITASWILYGPKGSIKEIDNDDLLKIYELDPNVIEVDEEAGMPVVKAYDDEEVHLIFYCIHCDLWHSHGRGGEEYPYKQGRGGMAGDRSPHCTSTNSPFNISGYILDVVGKAKEVNPNFDVEYSPLCPVCYKEYSKAFRSCECGWVDKENPSKFPKIAKIYQTRITERFIEETPQPSETPNNSIENFRNKTLIVDNNTGDVVMGNNQKTTGSGLELSQIEKSFIELNRVYGSEENLKKCIEDLLR